mgnify:CR=1 FL=1|tara:strand:+ start:478 stop:1068 length:591 start_codon:yes stop_codon:yes gene_type:complete
MPTYPLNLPTDPSPKNVDWEQVSRVSYSRSPLTGKQKAYAHSGQWWRVSFDLPQMQEAKTAEWTAMLLRLNGKEGYFNFIPTEDTPQGNVGGTGSAIISAVSGYEVTLNTVLSGGGLTAGDWVQIGTGLYRVTARTSIATETYELWPKPRAGIVLETTTLNYGNPKGMFRLAEGFRWDVNLAKTTGISLVAEEVLI